MARSLPRRPVRSPATTNAVNQPHGLPGRPARRRRRAPFRRAGHAAALRVAILAAQVVPVAGAATDPVVALDFSGCTIGGDAGSLPASCATLAVPLDAELPEGASIELAIARIEARGRNVADDPLVFIAGGPGQSARDTYPAVSSAFAEIARGRDILLIDQRGTGASGALDCEAADDADDDTASADEDAVDAVDAAVRTSRACLDSLDVDPTLYTTSVAVRDLERVRTALGVARWNLYGVSYGTRVAMHYARRHPERVRTLVLDAVVPPGTPLGADIAPHAQRALDAVLGRCEQDTEGCASAFPDIRARTRELVRRLGEAPVRVVHEDIATGGLREETFSREDLAATLRLLTYSAWGASILPSMLHAAIEDEHLAPLARQADMQSRALDSVLSTGMHYAVVCTEDLPFTDLERALDAARDTYLGPTPIRALAAACEAWPRGRIDADFHDPLSLDVPTLILSGTADPVTPPAFGDALLAGLPNARHVVLEGQGHMQAPNGCVPRLMARFVSEADAAALDIDCLRRLSAPPFFVDANGPRP